MIYKLILVFLILLIIISYFRHNLNYEQFQNFILINELGNNKNAITFNINKNIKIPNTNYIGFMMNGNNSYILIKKLNINIFSISLLINTKNIDKTQTILNSNNNSLLVGIKNNKFFLQVNDKILEIDKITPIPNIYYQISITYNNELNFYVNGHNKNIPKIDLSFDNISIGITKNTNGSIINYENAFYGILGDIKIYNTELNRDQICKINNKCIPIDMIDSETEEKKLSDYKNMIKEITNLGKQCLFQPKGQTMLACKDRCNSNDKTKWGGDKCTEEKCDEICKDCDNIEKCTWIKETEDHAEFIKKPKPFFIKGYALNGKIKITWINASQKDILEYFISINEQFKQSLRLNFTSKSDNGLNNFTIINLKNNVPYEISLYAKNKYGISPQSNILKIVPKNSEDDGDEDNEDTQTISVDDSVNNNVKQMYSTDGNIDISNNMSNNEYKEVIDFIDARNKFNNTKYNLDINFN